MIDSKLRNIVLNEFDNMTYYPCINRTSDKRKEVIIFNRLMNVGMKYKILKDINAIEIAKRNSIEMIVRKTLSTVSVNRINMFETIE